MLRQPPLPVPPAVAAFDLMAERFDERFGEWASVAAQRNAVRRHLLATFPPASHLLELAGGTGEDALFMAAHGRSVLLTDGSRAMMARAAAKAAAAGVTDRVSTRQLVLERLDAAAVDARELGGTHSFDGAWSNFAGLNCVADLRPVARGLARLLPHGASALLVMFGPLPPAEIVTQLVRGDPQAAFRRLRRRRSNARIGGMGFDVHYPAPRAVARVFTPWFRLHRIRGIGVFVPPSAAEPFISRHPRILRMLERLDRAVAAPLALLGDHVLLHFVRTAERVDGGST
jgi:SAM-dependent methyltransferase